MRALYIALCFTFVFSATVSAQETLWMATFKDRPDTVWDASQDYHVEALKRRGGRLNPSDYPVCERYIRVLRASGADVRYALRWFNAVSFYADHTTVEQLESLSFITEIVPLQGALKAAPAESYGVLQPNGDIDEPSPLLQFRMHEGELLSQRGLCGEGMRIAIFDVGFSGWKSVADLKHLKEEGRVEATFDFVRNNESVAEHSSHGTSVLSCIAGKSAHDQLGFAPEAQFFLAITEKPGTDITSEEDCWLAALEWADRMGVHIINSSLGYTYHRYFRNDLDGKTTFISQATLIAASKGILVVSAAGNEGNKDWRFISTPADADSILSVGGISKDLGLRADFSSVGPTRDYRVKPEVVSLGQAETAVRSGRRESWGTSFAAPLIAGLAACVWQAYPEETNMQIRERIIRGGHLYPFYNYSEGYGVPLVSKIFEDPTPPDTTFTVHDTDNGWSIELVHHSDSLIEQNDFNRYVYIHLADKQGRLLHYTTIEPQGKKGGEVPYDLIEEIEQAGGVIRIYYRGYLYEEVVD
ncbi:MAG: hypothetical protein RL226_371 [Bacteroidota bacterium]